MRLPIHLRGLSITDYVIIASVIDWFQLAAHSSWILGAALLLALTSRQVNAATEGGEPLRNAWARLGAQPGSWGGLLLIGAGLAGTGRSPWEVIFWTLFALLCGGFGLLLRRRQAHPVSE